MVSVYLYTLCGLACPPVSSAVHVGWGGRAEATAEAAWWPSPASQPLDMGKYSVTKNFLSNQNTVHHIMHHTYGSFVWQQNVSGYWVVPWPLWPRTLVMVVSGVWSVESLPQRPLRPEEAGPAPVPVTSLCSVLPPSSPSPSVTTGHQEDMVRTSDQHQQGNNSVINYTQPAPASREPDVTHDWPSWLIIISVLFPFPSLMFILWESERTRWYLRRSFSEHNWQCVSVCLAGCYVRSYSFESNIH